jgi:Arm DNA-binding domain
MPRKLNHALTPLTVKNAKAGRHADGGGLNLLVKESGARSWVFRFMLNGKSRDVGLGAAAGPDAISLSNARDLASALRLKVKAGIDPLEQRQREAAQTLAAAQAAHIAGVTALANSSALLARFVSPSGSFSAVVTRDMIEATNCLKSGSSINSIMS